MGGNMAVLLLFFALKLPKRKELFLCENNCVILMTGKLPLGLHK